MEKKEKTMDLDMIVFGTYTVKDIVIYGGGAFAVLMVLGFIRKMFASEKPDKHSEVTQCESCGWHGRISVYAGRCPKCNAQLGSRKAGKT